MVVALLLIYLMATVAVALAVLSAAQSIRLYLVKRELRLLNRSIDELARARARQIIEKEREDAIKKSQAVVSGKIYEQLAPFLPWFRYNPRDARFLGSPVDLVVFDGLDEGRLRAIRFVEVKSGQSRLSDRERMVKEAVESCRVTFEIVEASQKQ